MVLMNSLFLCTSHSWLNFKMFTNVFETRENKSLNHNLIILSTRQLLI